MDYVSESAQPESSTRECETSVSPYAFKNMSIWIAMKIEHKPSHDATLKISCK